MLKHHSPEQVGNCSAWVCACVLNGPPVLRSASVCTDIDHECDAEIEMDDELFILAATFHAKRPSVTGCSFRQDSVYTAKLLMSANFSTSGKNV